MNYKHTLVIGGDTKRYRFDMTIDDAFSFDWPINSSVQKAEFRIRSCDLFAQKPDLFNDEVIYLYRTDCNGNECLIYTGIINSYSVYGKPDEAGIIIKAEGNGSLLSRQITTLRSTYSVGVIPNRYLEQEIEEIMTRFISEADCLMKKIQFTIGTLNATGLIYNYKVDDFASNTGINFPIETLNNLVAYVQADHFWRLTPQGVFDFQKISTKPDHIFAYGTDILEYETGEDMTGYFNTAILYWSSTSTTITTENFDDNNCPKYKVFDYTGIAQNDTANQSMAILEVRNLMRISQVGSRSAVIKLHPRFDVCKIKVGDTFAVGNVPLGQSVFGENMLITKISYRDYGITIEANIDPDPLATSLDQIYSTNA